MKTIRVLSLFLVFAFALSMAAESGAASFSFAEETIKRITEEAAGKGTSGVTEKKPEEYKPSDDTIESKVRSAAKESFKSRSSIEVGLFGDNVVVNALGNDNLSAELVRDGMLKSIYDVMMQAHTLPVSFDFLISFPMIDKKGHESERIVMKVSFSRELVQEINWDKFLFIDIPEVADRYVVHPAFDIK